MTRYAILHTTLPDDGDTVVELGILTSSQLDDVHRLGVDIRHLSIGAEPIA